MEITTEERSKLLAEVSDAAYNGAARAVREWIKSRQLHQPMSPELFSTPENEAETLLERQMLKTRRLARTSTEALRIMANRLAVAPQNETAPDAHRRNSRFGAVLTELTGRGIKVSV